MRPTIPELFTPEAYAAISADVPPQRPRVPKHKRRVEWRHMTALLRAGIPIYDLYADGDFTFGIATIQGREYIATDDNRLRGYLHGIGIFKFPVQP